MTMRTASPVRSPCEVIRKINDLFQGYGSLDIQVRSLCAEAERGSKQLAQELNKYKKEAWKGWWKENKSYKSDLKRRVSDDYKQEGSLR